MTPEEIIENLKDAVEIKWDKEIVNNSILFYDKGWYYVQIARQHKDGSVGISKHMSRPLRKKQILEFIETLDYEKLL